MADWRLWLNMRVARDPREWGVPAIAWFAVGPYVLLALAWTLTTLWPAGAVYLREIDALSALLVPLVAYTVIVSLVLGVTSISRERASRAWESLLATPVTGADIVLAKFVSAVAPVVSALLVSTTVWMVTHFHYLPLLKKYTAAALTSLELVRLGLGGATAALAWCAAGLLAASLTRSPSAALLLGVSLALTVEVPAVLLTAAARTSLVSVVAWHLGFTVAFLYSASTAVSRARA
jgi:ABC-type transport system involved in multi-copper enzyme maturation permease subunit